MNTTRSIDSESPIADFDEELFHLEMSDEGSGGKRSKLGKYFTSRQNDFKIGIQILKKH